MLKRIFQSKILIRFHHNCTAIPLDHRALVQIQGNDSSKFLQGLITNDIEYLTNTNAIYSMLLNARGRILYDMIIYNHNKIKSSYLIEISQNALADFTRLLRTYKLRKQIHIEDVTPLYRIWSILSSENDSLLKSDTRHELIHFKTREGLIVGQTDPRHACLGIRLITERQTDISQLTDLCDLSKDVKFYKKWLHQHGIAEGIEDIPPGECIPLEYNIVFLNGVSFSKGCYIGQELVARTHHTGVIRKRLMPVKISNFNELRKDKIDDKSDELTIINEETKRRCGKLHNSIDEYGIGLIRLNEWKSHLRIANANVRISPFIPSWWPPLDQATKLEMKLDDQNQT